MKRFFRTIGLGLLLQFVFMSSDMAQIIDSTYAQPITVAPKQANKQLSAKAFIAPGILIGYGIWANNNPTLQSFNHSLQEALYNNRPHEKVHIDNYLQYAPAAFAIGLSCAGVKGKDNTKDILLIYALSNIIMNTSVQVVKHTSHQLRPDGSAFNSFPSGHTAEAFASAELLRMEYKNKSPWYGIVGYGVAAVTGYLRMYNNKHWFSDVLAGAGFGIASTKIAYWTYSKLRPHFYKRKKNETFIFPAYLQGNIGMALVYRPQ